MSNTNKEDSLVITYYYQHVACTQFIIPTSKIYSYLIKEDILASKAKKIAVRSHYSNFQNPEIGIELDIKKSKISLLQKTKEGAKFPYKIVITYTENIKEMLEIAVEYLKEKGIENA